VNSKLNKELVHGICISLVETGWTKEQYLELVKGNDWILQSTVDDISAHLDQACKIIKLAKRLEEKQKKQKTPDQYNQSGTSSSD
jgi:hypothetical protein